VGLHRCRSLPTLRVAPPGKAPRKPSTTRTIRKVAAISEADFPAQEFKRLPAACKKQSLPNNHPTEMLRHSGTRLGLRRFAGCACYRVNADVKPKSPGSRVRSSFVPLINNPKKCVPSKRIASFRIPAPTRTTLFDVLKSCLERWLLLVIHRVSPKIVGAE
jgi:hypothetical protein